MDEHSIEKRLAALEHAQRDLHRDLFGSSELPGSGEFSRISRDIDALREAIRDMPAQMQATITATVKDHRLALIGDIVKWALGVVAIVVAGIIVARLGR